ncbi:MAG: toll/interleukin-1 receptor domain-containing protein [Eubacterium sp.]|nr:toll/interleukin-1 receptor domain-containing protein [Eubacterium sp.]
MKYEAFISYRHGGIDGRVAAQVQKEIEKYHIPGKIAKKIGKKRVGRVFRDEDELQASSDLSALIREAIDESEWLIVIGSERYLESPWCLEEIEYFIRQRGREKILVILVSGEPKDVFPKALTEVERDGELVQIEPLAVDIRGSSEHAILKNLKQERFRFFSSMLGVDYDDLRNRQRERRRRRMALGTGTVIAILSVVIGVVTVKNIQLNEAYDALDQSNRQTLRGESYYLAEYADEAYLKGDPQTAMMLALTALPEDLDNPDRPYVADAIRSLTDATGVYDYSAGYHAGFVRNREEEVYKSKTRISKDGSVMLIETYEETGADKLDREVEVLRVSDGEVLGTYEEAPIARNQDAEGTVGAELSEDGERLYYLAGEGLTCVNTADGKEIFTAEKAVDMRINLKAAAEETAILTVDYEGGRLYGYDLNGEKTLNAEIGNDLNYELGTFSPDGKSAVFSANTEMSYGAFTIDLKSGETAYYPMEGKCSDACYSGAGRLCFFLSDVEDELKHIVQFDTTNGDQRYLCNADWVISEKTVTDKETCYYYHDNTVYEIDCNSKKGKKLWEHNFSSAITSLRAGDGLVAISCRDGAIYVFEEDGKRQIHTPASAGEAVYVDAISRDVLTTKDYWGRSVRIYQRRGPEYHEDARQVRISDAAAQSIPDVWYGAQTGCDRFLFGSIYGGKHRLAEFDAAGMERIAERELTDIGENNAIEQKTADYIMLEDYDYYTLHHFDAATLKEVYRGTLNDTKRYYREDGKVMCESKDHKLRVIEAATGKVLEETAIPDGFDSGIRLGDTWIYSSAKSIRIDGEDGKTRATLDDASLEVYNEERGLILYRNELGDTWTVYDVKNNRAVLEKETGKYPNMIFFGNNRYILKDYTEVYDMDNWTCILTLDAGDGNVYGAQTTESLPYIVVRRKQTGVDTTGRDAAYLYEKGGSGELVGVIPNYVALSSEGEIVTFDGEHILYRFPLLNPSQVMERARQLVGDRQLTDSQKEQYHLFDQ